VEDAVALCVIRGAKQQKGCKKCHFANHKGVHGLNNVTKVRLSEQKTKKNLVFSSDSTFGAAKVRLSEQKTKKNLFFSSVSTFGAAKV
jgi:hypothetical protein